MMYTWGGMLRVFRRYVCMLLSKEAAKAREEVYSIPEIVPQIHLVRPVDFTLSGFFSRKSDSKMLQELTDFLDPNLVHKMKLKNWLSSGLTFSSVDQEQLNHLGFLIHCCSTTATPDALRALLTVIDRRELLLTESHYNAILLSMDHHGWHSSVKANLRQMLRNGIKCRLETLFTLAARAAERKDFHFAVELMQYLSQGMQDITRNLDRPLAMERLIDSCVGVGQRGVGLVKEVLKWHSVVQTDLTVDTSESLVRWLQSLENGPKIVKTQICSNGHCMSCGEKLESADIPVADHSSLLTEMEELIVKMEHQYLPKSQSPCLHALKEVIQKDRFGAVIDGMNVALVGSQTFNTNQLIQVSRQLKQISGLPSLVILRWYCAKEFKALGCKQPLKSSSSSSSSPSSSSCLSPPPSPVKTRASLMSLLKQRYEPHHLHFFFVNNNTDDDLYSLYATLASGHKTLLVSNDRLGDKRVQLSRDVQVILDQWQRSRQVSFCYSRRQIDLSVPLKYKRVVQWTDSGQWHIPQNGSCWCFKLT